MIRCVGTQLIILHLSGTAYAIPLCFQRPRYLELSRCTGKTEGGSAVMHSNCNSKGRAAKAHQQGQDQAQGQAHEQGREKAGPGAGHSGAGHTGASPGAAAAAIAGLSPRAKGMLM